ncbi:alginate export family protein [Henriciella mobilis]|uniref:alginate export family protein n=1 Tax=Henriciella mobilis TaxID=2305467 RepID=UPI000E664750|nr:alginate export family protein [Henriciella mobilis]RIJ18212.1 alginate export family protein [Henriciella mobilis]RIJ24981.1 alginate export family protein [Henriciella mobilis]
MKRHHILAALACASAATVGPFAQAQENSAPSLQKTFGSDAFKIDGSFRTRFEGFDGAFRSSGATEDSLVSFRTLINAEYDAGSFRFGGTLQDSRAYDADTDTPLSTAEVNTFELLQAYVTAELGDFAGAGTSTELTAGRFTMNLGSKRLAATPGFRNTGNGFTGVKADWKGAGKQKFTAFYTLPQQRLPSAKSELLDNETEWDREGDDLRFWGAFFSTPAVNERSTVELYFYGLDEDDRSDRATRNRHLLTPGARIYSDQGTGLFDYEFEGAWQTGDIRTSSAAAAPQVDVSAYTIAAEVGYTFDTSIKPRVALVGNIASGDDPDSSDFNRFDTLFGIRRGEWGPSSSLFGPLSRNNIRDLGVRFEFKPSKRLDGFISAHSVWLDEETDSFAKTGIRDASGSSGDFGANQVEARLRYWIVPDFLQMDIGGAVLNKGSFLKDAPNVQDTSDTHYGYVDFYIHF